MTIKTIMTTLDEAEMIATGKKRHIFRSDYVKVGDLLQFVAMRNKKPVIHDVSNKMYIVTSVEDDVTAPVIKGFKIIAYRELS